MITIVLLVNSPKRQFAFKRRSNQGPIENKYRNYNSRKHKERYPSRQCDIRVSACVLEAQSAPTCNIKFSGSSPGKFRSWTSNFHRSSGDLQCAAWDYRRRVVSETDLFEVKHDGNPETYSN